MLSIFVIAPVPSCFNVCSIWWIQEQIGHFSPVQSWFTSLTIKNMEKSAVTINAMQIINANVLFFFVCTFFPPLSYSIKCRIPCTPYIFRRILFARSSFQSRDIQVNAAADSPLHYIAGVLVFHIFHIYNDSKPTVHSLSKFQYTRNRHCLSLQQHTLQPSLLSPFFLNCGISS